LKRLTALVGLGSVTCSLMIAGESAPVHCSQEGQLGPPACDEGLTCHAGICRGLVPPAPIGGGPGSPPITAGPGGSGGDAGAETAGAAGSG
jgi:hypothetical protein